MKLRWDSNARFTPPAPTRQDSFVCVVSGAAVWIGQLLLTCPDFKFSVADSLERSNIQFTRQGGHDTDKTVLSRLALRCELAFKIILTTCSSESVVKQRYCRTPTRVGVAVKSFDVGSSVLCRFVAWHSGRTSVSDWRTFPVLRSTCSWWVTRAALSIWWALRTSPCRGPNPSVDRRERWIPSHMFKCIVVNTAYR